MLKNKKKDFDLLLKKKEFLIPFFWSIFWSKNNSFDIFKHFNLETDSQCNCFFERYYGRADKYTSTILTQRTEEDKNTSPKNF